jgi:hypothetical protein
LVLSLKLTGETPANANVAKIIDDFAKQGEA